MESLGNFFDKYKKIIFNKTENKKIISKILGNILKTEIKEDSILISGKTLTLKISPVAKQEIFIHREYLIEELNKNGIKISEIK